MTICVILKYENVAWAITKNKTLLNRNFFYINRIKHSKALTKYEKDSKSSKRRKRLKFDWVSKYRSGFSLSISL